MDGLASPFEKFNWFERIRGISPVERLVLGCLVLQAGASGHVEKYNTRSIAYSTELQRRTVFTAIAALEAKGFLRRGRRRKGGGSVGSMVANEYWLELNRTSAKSILANPKQKGSTPKWSPDPGARLGRLMFKLVLDDWSHPPDYLQPVDAYYNGSRRVLTIWFEHPRAAALCWERRDAILTTLRNDSTKHKFSPPEGMEFLHPTGGFDTPLPKSRNLSRD